MYPKRTVYSTFTYCVQSHTKWELRPCPCVQWLVLDNISRHSARRYSQWRRQVHLPRPAASGKISVLRADHHLIGTRRYSRPRIDARAATRLDHARASLLEDFEIAAALRVFAR